MLSTLWALRLGHMIYDFHPGQEKRVGWVGKHGRWVQILWEQVFLFGSLENEKYVSNIFSKLHMFFLWYFLMQTRGCVGPRRFWTKSPWWHTVWRRTTCCGLRNIAMAAKHVTWWSRRGFFQYTLDISGLSSMNRWSVNPVLNQDWRERQRGLNSAHVTIWVWDVFQDQGTLILADFVVYNCLETQLWPTLQTTSGYPWLPGIACTQPWKIVWSIDAFCSLIRGVW